MCTNEPKFELWPLQSTRDYFSGLLRYALTRETLRTVHQAGVLPPRDMDPGRPLGAQGIPRLDLIFSGEQRVSIVTPFSQGQVETLRLVAGEGLFYPAFAPYRVDWSEPCMGMGVVWNEDFVRLVAFEHQGGARTFERSPYYLHTADALGGCGGHLLAALSTGVTAPMEPSDRLALARLLLAATRGHLLADQGRPRPASKAARTWYEAERYLDMHLSEHLTREQVADACGVTGSYLSRLCRQQSGHSYQRHLTHLRLERAKQLLSRSRLNAKDVAYSCGFSNPRHFNDTFVKETGLSPGQFSRQQRVE